MLGDGRAGRSPARDERRVACDPGSGDVGERLRDVMRAIGSDTGWVRLGPREDEIVAEDRAAERLSRVAAGDELILERGSVDDQHARAELPRLRVGDRGSRGLADVVEAELGVRGLE